MIVHDAEDCLDPERLVRVMVLCSCQTESEELHSKTLWKPDSGVVKLCILHDKSTVQDSRCVSLPSFITHMSLVVLFSAALRAGGPCFRSLTTIRGNLWVLKRSRPSPNSAFGGGAPPIRP